MKKSILLSMFLCGLFSVSLTAGTYRVNNKLANNPAAKIYSAFQAAHDAAYNGDTIMIDGSSLAYTGSFNCTKQLVIKGPGYFLDENPGISANKLPAAIASEIHFDNGSAGSLLMSIESTYTFYLNDNNITVRRCRLLYGLQIFAENITVTECYMEGIGNSLYGSIVTNLVLTNNIIMVPVSFQAGSTGVLLNNVFTVDWITIPTGFDMKNNILFFTGKSNVSLPMLPDPDVSYNISLTDHFGTLNHNKANVAESSLFIGSLTESKDRKWQLKDGSLAIAAGEGGINCGAYGGPQPYILSGVPAGPVIYELNVSSYSTTDNKLPVTIKVKSY